MSPIHLKLAFIYCMLICLSSQLVAQEEHWAQTASGAAATQIQVFAKSQTLPALKYRFVLDEYEMLPENAALYYLKAMGFLEQNRAREEVNRMVRSGAEIERETGNEVAPFSWLSMPPERLPLDQVRTFLTNLEFQRPFFAQAAKRRFFELDRNIGSQKSPISYLLPEIQSIRDLSRWQSLRTRVAIAEGRIDDAIEIIGQQLTMAHHLGKDEFGVSCLVGIACLNMTCSDILYLQQHPDAPNLYWAFATLPRPLVSFRRAKVFEMNLLQEQIKELRLVNDVPRAEEYWREVVSAMAPNWQDLDQMGEMRDAVIPWNNQTSPANTLWRHLEANADDAHDFLAEVCEMPQESIDALPAVQQTLLALVEGNRILRDEIFKWNSIPFDRSIKSPEWIRSRERISELCDRYGWCLKVTRSIHSSVDAWRKARLRPEQFLNMAQTIEALRWYSADHDGNLPRTLDELPVPACVDQFSGLPFAYVPDTNSFTLSSSNEPGRIDAAVEMHVQVNKIRD